MSATKSIKYSFAIGKNMRAMTEPLPLAGGTVHHNVFFCFICCYDVDKVELCLTEVVFATVELMLT